MPLALTYKDVKKIFDDKGCTLLDNEYLPNIKSKLEYIAICGHINHAYLYYFKIMPYYNCKDCNIININSKYFCTNTENRMHPKTFQKVRKVMEFEIKRTMKYRVDFLPENYNAQLICWDCGETKNRRLFPYRKQYSDNKEKRCKLCNLSNVSIRRENMEVSQHINTLLKTAKESAKRRLKNGRIECGVFNLTPVDIKGLIDTQNNKCKFSGKELIWEFNDNYKASIDRIDSNKGYTKDNIQLVSMIVNQAKNNLDDDDFLELIKQIYEFRIT
jgi:hypothetical protein